MNKSYEDYNKALETYDNLSEEDKIRFKEYVFTTWVSLHKHLPEYVKEDFLLRTEN